jgi:hypothetical protein
MQTVVKSCLRLQKSRELEVFERYQVKNNNLRKQLTGMII